MKIVFNNKGEEKLDIQISRIFSILAKGVLFDIDHWKCMQTIYYK